MRKQVWSLASLSGLRILRCCGCGVSQQLQLRFDPLAWKFPYAAGVALKRKKKGSLYVASRWWGQTSEVSTSAKGWSPVWNKRARLWVLKDLIYWENGNKMPYLLFFFFLVWPTPQPQQYQILNPLSKARDWTYVLMDISQIRFCWAMMGTPHVYFYLLYQRTEQKAACLETFIFESV